MLRTTALFFLFSLVKVSFCGVITVFTQTGFQGVNLNISGCLPTLPSNLDRQIKGTHAHDNCIQFYKQPNCSGEYLRVPPGVHHHDNLREYGFSNNIRSIGSCFEKCHPDLIQSPEAPSTDVEFYDDYSTRPRNRFTVKPFFCLDITREMSSWSPRRPITIRLDASVCVELHQFGNCSGSSIHLSVGNYTTRHEKLAFFPQISLSKSLSFCGYNCNKSSEGIIGTGQVIGFQKEVLPPDGTLTFFRYKDFAGERTDLVLRGCTQLPKRWTGDHMPGSMIPYDLCVMLYDAEDCSGLSNVEAIIGAEPELNFQTPNLKAVKICPKLEGVDDEGGEGACLWVGITPCAIILTVGISGVIYWVKKSHGKNENRVRFRYRSDNLSESNENL